MTVLEDRNPATGELLGSLEPGGVEEADAAVATARAAFDRWRRVPAPARGEILLRAAERLAERREDVARLIVREMGKVLAEARGDVQDAIETARFMAGEGRRQYGVVAPSETPGKHAMAFRAPVGVVAAITPWNFPVAIPMWKLAPALVTGNTVVLKPSSETPLVAAALVEALYDAGLPEGVVTIVNGPGGAIGDRLVRHPDVAAVSFTGSQAAGTRVNEAGAAGLKRIHLELGGKNAVVVLDDADLDAAADGIVTSAFATSGQRCTAASRVIVDRRVHDPLAARVEAHAAALRLGDGLDPETDVGPVVNRASLESIDAYANGSSGIAVGEGARVLTGGEVAADGTLAGGCFYRPTVLAGVEVDMRIAQEEVFGPVTALIACDGLDDAIAKANRVPYGLAAAIYTRDVGRAFAAVHELEAGVVSVNGGTGASEPQLPFGGVKQTGNGRREGGTAALDTFTEWKSVYVHYA